MENLREYIKGKQRIVIKIGSSSLQHAETGDMDYVKIEKFRFVYDLYLRPLYAEINNSSDKYPRCI